MLVVDLSQNVGGRFAAKLLAMAGLDVVRVVDEPASSSESPLSESTLSGPPLPPPGSPVYLDVYLDAHVRRVAEPVEDLIAGADVVMTSFDQGAYDGGWSDERVRTLNADVVHVTASSFGVDGPYAPLRGSSLVDWASGGYLFITGDPEREPLAGPQHLCGYVAGYTAAIGAEAGLAARARGARGIHVDISAMDAMIGLHQSTFSRLGAGLLRTRTGRYTEVYPLVARPCRDGYVSLGMNAEEEFDRFVVAMGRPELAVDPRFVNRDVRTEHRDELDLEMDPFLLSHDADDLVELLQRHRIPSAKVVSTTELLADPQLAARGYWDVADVAGHPARMPGNPVPAGHRYDGAPASAPAAPEAHGGLPLAGTIVLDFTAFWAGPSATRNLADLGARVIRIERPNSRVDPPADPTEFMHIVMGVFFHWKMNRHKESIVIDLKSTEGCSLVLELVAQADVLIENFRPGVMDALGLDPATLAACNPDLVQVSLSGFGSTGPRAWWGSYGPTIEAASSIEDRTGYPGGEPLRLGHTLPDAVGGLLGTLAVLRGLRERSQPGEASRFDLSQLEAYSALSGEAVLASSVLGVDIERSGNQSPTVAWQGVCQCIGEDEWVGVTLFDDADLDRFAAVNGGIRPAAETVAAALDAFAAARDKHGAAQELQRAGISAFPVLTAAELVVDPQVAWRASLVDVPFAGRTVKLPGSAIHASPPLVRTTGVAPRLGEHGAAVLREVLGYDDARIAALATDGVVVLPPAPPIVVVMGPTGAGKTTVGELLAARMGVPFVDADDFHDPANIERMRQGIPLDDTARRPWLRRLSDVLREARAYEGVVLACSALTDDARDALAPGAGPVRYVALVADASLLRERVAHRAGHFAGPALVDSQLAALDVPDDAIVIDAAAPPDEIVARVLAALGIDVST